MAHRWTTRMAWLAAFLGLTLATALFAPARWLGTALAWGTKDQVRLVNTRGSVWHGQGDLLLTGGEGSRTESALPQGLRWRLKPTWAEGRPAIALQLETPCCSPRPVNLKWIPAWKGFTLRVAAFGSQWPAVLLTGLGTPWNTLRPEGQLGVQSSGLSMQLLSGQLSLQGGLRVDALDMTSRLSTLRPLGSYRVNLEATPDGNSAQLQLTTLRGGLQLQGSGQWIGGRLRFQGEAQAAPGRENALENLLNIIGRRQGPRSILKVG
ncbi:type II secretion system protein N [Hydrogenophaga sp. PAMC20947]|nr:type II secretion system protein N [Hydrogenophaga sp. PAMC20947]